MENLKDDVELIAKHWGCTTTNVYGQMKKPQYANKISIMKLGSMCKENNISEKQLSNIIDFIKKQKELDV